jgi:hypothetical protein
MILTYGRRIEVHPVQNGTKVNGKTKHGTQTNELLVVHDETEANE